MAKAIDVANVFLKLSEPDTGDFLTNLKVQKLVYYAQGFHLAMFGKALFDEPILHWEHGPVVRELYDEFKSLGNKPIPVPEAFTPTMFNNNQIELLTEINSVYGQFSAWKLRDMTHTEKPWLDTAKDEVIDHDSLRLYFTSLSQTE